MQRVLKILSIVAAYAVTVGGVLVALLVAIPDDPWLPALAAMAILHLGFGLIVARMWTVALPLAVSLVAGIADAGGFSITTFLVGVPCAMLLLAGVSLRLGWDDGGRARQPVPKLRRGHPRLRRAPGVYRRPPRARDRLERVKPPRHPPR